MSNRTYRGKGEIKGLIGRKSLVRSNLVTDPGLGVDEQVEDWDLPYKYLVCEFAKDAKRSYFKIIWTEFDQLKRTIRFNHS